MSEEKWITVAIGPASFRRIPESEWDRLLEESRRLEEEAVSRGLSPEKARELYALRIAEDEEMDKLFRRPGL